MFTGIIEGFGTIREIRSSGNGTSFLIDSDFNLERTKIGDSIAVNGACLTAVTIEGRRFLVDVAPETLEKSIFDKARVGDRVNLERALRLSDRLDGHLVSGHVDGIGILKSKQRLSNAIIISIEVPESLARYMIPKGSVAIDGISLTINKCDRNSFEISIIPHTAMLTTIGFKDVGDRVNLETDMIGKYVEKFVLGKSGDDKGNETDSASGIDLTFLAKNGFM
jgi:riboflavin synthase